MVYGTWMFNLFMYLQCLFSLLLFCCHWFATALRVLWDLFFFILFGYCGPTGVIISFIIPQNINCELKFARGEGELFRDLIQLMGCWASPFLLECSPLPCSLSLPAELDIEPECPHQHAFSSALSTGIFELLAPDTSPLLHHKTTTDTRPRCCHSDRFWVISS